MPRDNYNDTIISVDSNGAPTVLLTGILVTVYQAGTTTLATIYVARTGSAQITNPFQAPNGRVSFWADSGEYDVLYHDMIAPIRIADQVYGWEAMSSAAEGVPGMMLAKASVPADRAALDLLNMLIPVGTVLSYGGSVAPTGFSLCDGSSLLRSSYASLFAVIGTTYGAADGTHFSLPDCRGRMPVGAGNGPGLNAKPLSAKSGAETVQLASGHMPSHAHSVYDPQHAHGVADPGHAHAGQSGWSIVGNNGTVAAANMYPTSVSPGHSPSIYTNGAASNIVTDARGTGIGIYGAATGIGIYAAGGDTPHDNMPPYISLSAIIRNGQ